MPKDPLCPLGFHPQVRWPTRCKRCFREYKEHAPKKEEERNSYKNDSDFRKSTFSSSLDKKSSSDISTRSAYSSSTTDSYGSSNSKKDYSTPYSSISTEAQIRLNRLRVETPEVKTAATTESLLSTPASKTTVAQNRRRTTDLSHILESDNVHNRSTTTTIPSQQQSSFISQPTPPERRKFTSSQSQQSSSGGVVADESVIIRLKKSNSFSLSDSGSSSNSRESSVSPVPRRAKTPTIEEGDVKANNNDTKSSVRLRVPSVKVSDSSDSSESASQTNTDSKPKKLKKKRLLIQGVQEVPPPQSPDDSENGSSENSDNQSADVAFIIQVKSTRKKKKEDDDETMSMTTTTDTTETTLVDVNEFNQSSGISFFEHEELKKETERLRDKCRLLEKEKAEFLSRRVESLNPPKVQSAEYTKLQQKVNQVVSLNEDLKDEQKHLESKVRELETELASRPNAEMTKRTIAELKSRLSTAEAQIDQLHEEKREAIQQMKDMQEEFEELQDSFREEHSEDFATIKKELDEAKRDARLLQFKLRKTEKRADQLEAEKNELETRVESSKTVRKLEEELSNAKAEIEKLLRDTKDKGSGTKLSPGAAKKKSPVLTKAPSGEAVEPPIPSDIDSGQLLRDLQSTLERESDLREQLKFAEEEVTSLRQKTNRIEDENESLLIQIKKMSSKSRQDVSSNVKVNGNQSLNGDKLDAAELKIQLEINEQESKILRRKVEELENSNCKLTKDLQITEDKLQTLSLESGTNVTKSKSVDEVSLLRRKIIEKEREIERLQTELLAVASKNKGKIIRAKTVEADDSSKRQENELRGELKKVQNEMSKIKTESESQKRNLEEELIRSKGEIENHQGKVMQLAEMNKNLVVQMEKFKQEMVAMKEHYETVQEDFVIKNSQLISMREEKDNSFKKLRKEYDTIDKELTALRETFNSRQDTWIKEKLAMQERMKEYEEKQKKLTTIPGDKDSMRYRHLLKEQSNEMDVRSHELESYKDQILFMQKENDELRRQLDDFEKVSQVQMRSLSSEPSNKADRQLKELREKLLTAEKAHRNEIAQMKLRSEQQVALKNEEISTVQAQFSRAKRERDTFRQMVDSAQRAISELKSGRDTPNRRDSASSSLEEAAAGARAAVVSLQDRVTSLEDELTEARREASRARTELVTENSTWEMKLGELQQKINELEEDRLLGTGRNRAAGQKTRLELAWQKERDEQQRRLKETTTLARDLKTTLLEFERERDRDRMESRRRIDQLKAAMEEDQEELRRKVSQTECDLLELRDAHAKLRTANEKLRRDREKLEKERDIQLKKEMEIRRIHAERSAILDDLLQKVTTNPGTGSSSGDILRYLQALKGLKEPEELSSKERKRSNFRRAASAGETDERQSQESLASSTTSSVPAYGKEHYGRVRYPNNSSTLTLPSRSRASASPSSSRSDIQSSGAFPYNPKGSLYRKSLSLEQTNADLDEPKIWKGESDAGSASSITSMDGQFSLSRGSSVDSEKPKSSSLVGKMKKLVKSKSIEDPPSATAMRVIQAGVKVAAGVGSSAGSDVSLNYESDREKDTGNKLKDKVKRIFRRSSRSPSAERSKTPMKAPTPPPRSRESTPKKDNPTPSQPPPSTQRPLTHTTQRPLMRR